MIYMMVQGMAQHNGQLKWKHLKISPSTSVELQLTKVEPRQLQICCCFLTCFRTRTCTFHSPWRNLPDVTLKTNEIKLCQSFD